MTNQNVQPAGNGVMATSRSNGGGLGWGEGSGQGKGVERLEGYRLTLQLAAVAPALVPRGHASLRDQIDRASASVVLTLAEAMCSHYLLEGTGCGKRRS
jgi:hypothetical protein